MRYFYFIILTSFFSINANANYNALKTRIKGLVLDTNKKGVDLANVTIYDKKTNKIVKITTTNQTGTFDIEIEQGEYTLNIISLEYKPYRYSETIVISGNNTEIRIPTITLEPQINALDEMVVVGESTSIVNKIDRKVVNVGKDLNVVGADASFVMSNIPSVSVDAEGSVALRGNTNVIILIDGKMTNLEADDLLKTIPADAISQVEIITNPSSKYNPEGSSGIINIITKREKMTGTNGSVNTSIGTKDKYSAGTNININNEKIAFGINYNYRNFTFEKDINLKREILNINRYNITDKTGFSRDNNHVAKAMLDYFIDKTQKVSYSLNLDFVNRTEFEDINYLFLNSKNNDSININKRDSKDIRDRFSHNHTLNYKKNFSEGHYIEFDFGANFRKDKILGDYSNTDSILSTQEYYNIEKNISETKNNMYNISLDYHKELTNNTKIEAGYSTTIRNLHTMQNYGDILNDNFIKDNSRSSDFAYDESVHAVYGIFADKIEDWFDFQLGLRVENTITKVTSVTLDSIVNRNYWNFFPTIHLVKKLNDNNELSINYSRRISRPRGRSLDPTPIYSDQLNIRRGNPYLQPEFTNSLEIGYLFSWGSGSLSTSFFSMFKTDVIQRISELNNNNENVMTFGNIGKSNDYGNDLTIQNRFFKIWSIMFTLNTFYTDIKGNNQDFTNNGFYFSSRLNNNFSLLYNASLQINYMFNSKRPHAQGFINAFHRMDISMQKSFFDKSLNLGLRVSDVFNTMKLEVNSDQSQFIDRNVLKFETQVVFLTASYNFGIKNNDKKRNSKKQNEGEYDNSEMEF